MKEIWVKADPWQKELVTAALEAGADAVIVPDDKVKSVKELGIITTVAKGGDLKWEEDVVRVQIRSREDEEKIVDLSRNKKAMVDTTDWTIIPLENLVARSENIFVPINSTHRMQAQYRASWKREWQGLLSNTETLLRLKKLLVSSNPATSPCPL